MILANYSIFFKLIWFFIHKPWINLLHKKRIICYWKHNYCKCSSNKKRYQITKKHLAKSVCEICKKAYKTCLNWNIKIRIFYAEICESFKLFVVKQKYNKVTHTTWNYRTSNVNCRNCKKRKIQSNFN